MSISVLIKKPFSAFILLNMNFKDEQGIYDPEKIRKLKLFSAKTRRKWRNYLSRHFESDEEVWFVFPVAEADEKSLTYNDTVEEALCFGWIDSVNIRLDDLHCARRFSPRKKGSPYSRMNIERLIHLERQGMIHPKIRDSVLPIIQVPFEYPEDIIDAIRQDEEAWKNYQHLAEPYKRIRIAYIEAARKRPEEFQKRLNSFIDKTRKGKLITGYGGIEKYYLQKSASESDQG